MVKKSEKDMIRIVRHKMSIFDDIPSYISIVVDYVVVLVSDYDLDHALVLVVFLVRSTRTLHVPPLLLTYY